MIRPFVIAALALELSCSPVPLGDGERRIIARDLVNDVVEPTLDSVVDRAAILSTATEALAAAPSEMTLDAAQAAWRDAREPWKQSEAFGFGPAMKMRLGVAIDQSPIDSAKIDEELAGTATISDAYVATLGANRKGFHALEYLMFRGDDDAVILDGLTTDPVAERRRAYLVAIAHDLSLNAAALRDAWESGYTVRFTDPGSDNAEFPTIKSVIDTLTNESVFLAELIANAKIGKPAGTASGGTPAPELEESGPSDNSLADMADNLRGIRAIYTGSLDGAGTRGIGQLVAKASPATDRAVRDAIAAAIAAVEAIPRPFRSALIDQRPEVAAAHDAVKELKRLLATEVIAVLGATLKFNDNDGD
ncbi:MAG: imelysin family protein [Kofleriaceae bacterium]